MFKCYLFGFKLRLFSNLDANQLKGVYVMQVIKLMLIFFNAVTLVNRQGYSITVSSIAIGDTGVYTTEGKYYSLVSLEVLGYTLRK